MTEGPRALLRLLLACASSALIGYSCLAAHAAQSSISVVNGWAPPAPPGASVGAAYFEIDNTGPADTLLAIDSPIAQRVEMHSTTLINGIMRMRRIRSKRIPAGGRAEFAPTALHAMLIGLKHPMAAGETFPATMVFRHSGRRSTEIAVRNSRAADDAPAASAGPSGGYRLVPWPHNAPSPRFDLVDVEGRPRSLEDFAGSIVIVFFGFVQCPDTCPAELFKLSVVMKRLGSLSARMRVLFVTLDPQRDRPSLLKGYVKSFDPNFVPLTGTAAQTDAAAHSFAVEYTRVFSGKAYTIDHSTATFIFDTRGSLRWVASMNASIDDFVQDLSRLAGE